MQVENFKAGLWLDQFQYKSFSPAKVNQSWEWLDPGINLLLEQSSRALAELNALSLMVPDVDLFIKMHITKEANKSSRIEGTQTQMDEAIMRKDQIDPDKRDDWQEVQIIFRPSIQPLKTLRHYLFQPASSNKLTPF